MEYLINKKIISYEAEGNKTAGEDSVLLHRAIDLTYGKAWSREGYVVSPLFKNDRFIEFEQKTKQLLKHCWQKSGLAVAEDFQVEHYHRIAPTQELHLEAVENTKLLSASDFPVPISEIEDHISSICQTPLVAKNPFDNQSIFHFRVVRPNGQDNNPLHRDVWLPDYANCINLYIPIAGSNEFSSLSILPGSHHWPENKTVRTRAGASIEGKKYSVPAVTHIHGAYEIIRPNPQRNEVLVFSPYLIHGGAVNLNADQTRISIELRLWNQS